MNMERMWDIASTISAIAGLFVVRSLLQGSISPM